MAVANATFPVPLTSLIGREAETEQLAGMLRSGQARVVTLTGPGGVGKTRLALAVAEVVADDFDRRWFVPLASLTEAGLVAQAIGQVLDVTESGSERLIDKLGEALSDGRQLLVLDNFEQVLDGALILPRLLSDAPNLTVIITSRERLRISGEQEFPVPPLALPRQNGRRTMPADLEEFPAIRLFVERARAARPGFDLDEASAPAVADICVRLDGLPLALELAAARVRLLSPQAILQRLDDRLSLLVGGPRDLDPRQQTLRAAISWSYDLLDTLEQAAMRRLSIPVGSFTIEAAETLIGATGDVDPIDGFLLIESLLDKSLITEVADTGAEARFSMLESIRAFGLELAGQHDEIELLHEAHLRHLIGYVRQKTAELTGDGQREALLALDLEHDNIRNELEWAIEHRHTALAVELAEPLWRYWTTRGLSSEGFGWLMSLLDLPGLDEVPGRLRSRLFDGIGAIAYLMGDRRVAEQQYRAALDVLGDGADPRDSIHVLNHLAMAVQDQGDHDEATKLMEQALEQARLIGDPRQIGLSLYNLGYLASERRDYRRATELTRESMPYFERIGDDLGVADHLNTLGYLHYALGKFEAAREFCERSQTAFEALGDLYGAGEASGDLGLAFEALDRPDEAREAYERAIRLAGETGNNRRIVETRLGLGRVEWFAGNRERARQLFEQALSTNRHLDYHVGLIVSLLHVAAINLVAGRLDPAGQQLREALDLSRRINHLPGILLGLTAYAALNAASGNANEAGAYLASAGELERAETVQLLLYERRWLEYCRQMAGQVAGDDVASATEPEPVAGVERDEPPSHEEAAARFGITARELEVIALLVEGQSNQEIADQLFITRRTATTHVANIMNKVGLSSRTAVAALAVREGLV